VGNVQRGLDVNESEIERLAGDQIAAELLGKVARKVDLPEAIEDAKIVLAASASNRTFTSMPEIPR